MIFRPSTYREAQSAKAASEARKARRAEKAAQMAAMSGKTAPAKPQRVGRGRKGRAPSLSKLRKALWAVFAEYVKTRDAKKTGGLCLMGCGNPIESANHIVPASESPWTYYDEQNVFGGCRSCNISENYNRGTWATSIYPARFGVAFVGSLYAKANPKDANGRPIIKSWSKAEVRDLTEKYRTKLKELTNG